MSIKDFIETNTITNLGSTLPIPYLEIIEIEDDEIEIQSTMFLKVSSEQYEKDGGDSYVTFMLDDSALKTYAMLLFDRNTDTESFGMVDIPGSATSVDWFADPFKSRDISPFSNVVEGMASPLKYIYNALSDESGRGGHIATQFAFSNLANPIFRAALLRYMDYWSDEGSGGPDWSSRYSEYLLSNGETPTFNYLSDVTFEGSIIDILDYDGNADYDQYWYESFTTTGSNQAKMMKLLWLATRPEIAEELDSIIGRMMAASDGIILAILDSWFGVVDDSPYSSFDTGETGTRDIQVIIDYYGSDTISSYFGFDINEPGIKFVSVPNNIFELGGIEEYSHADTIYHADGSATFKYTRSVTLQTEMQTDPQYIDREIFNREDRTKATKVGLVSFSTPLDLTDTAITQEIVEAYTEEEGARYLYESNVSPVNSKVIFENDQISQEPVTVYRDSSGNIHDTAIQSLDGSYYADSTITLQDIASSLSSIVPPVGMNTSPADALRYIVARYGSSSDLLFHLNQYRRTYPDKSSVTPAGKYYTSFAEILGSSNKVVQRGTPVKKSVVTNPVVRDLRGVTFDAPSMPARLGGLDADTFAAEMFDMENGFWSRWTEVYNYVSSRGEIYTSESETVYTGGQWTYNFIDHGFLFFNYEKALKQDSNLAEILDVTKFEKYFGTGATSNAYQMKRAKVRCLYITPDIIWSDPILAESGHHGAQEIDVGSITLFLDNSGGYPANGYTINNSTNTVTQLRTSEAAEFGNVDHFTTTNHGNVTGDQPGAETMTGGAFTGGTTVHKVDEDFGGAKLSDMGSTKYSFLALRGWCPVTNVEGHNPLTWDKTFVLEQDINTRIACFQYQKLNTFRADGQGSDDLGTDDGGGGVHDTVGNMQLMIEAENEDIRFSAKLLVEDKTYDLFVALYNRLQDVRSEMGTYLTAASDNCAYNDTEGLFNDFFITAANQQFATAEKSPWYTAATFYYLIQDILHDTFGADSAQLIDRIKSETYNLAPETATITTITSFLTRWDSLMSYFDGFVDSGYTDGLVTDLCFGTDTQRSAADVLGDFDRLPEPSVYPLYGPLDLFHPGEVYENYPLYPTEKTDTTTILADLLVVDGVFIATARQEMEDGTRICESGESIDGAGDPSYGELYLWGGMAEALRSHPDCAWQWHLYESVGKCIANTSCDPEDNKYWDVALGRCINLDDLSADGGFEPPGEVD